ncbi:MAG: hypothetical protein JXB32_12940 [Deltaproteobacteria bacterium]|nr:hypothetical protein [Deltaproteobacteria bacterium]
MNRIRTLAAVVLAVVPTVGPACSDAPPAEEPLVAPPPRCAELEAKMLECAREATGLAELPASVAAGVMQAASLNCRRMRAASHDPELPTRVMAVCGAEPCDTFPACVNREAGPDVLLAAREPDQAAGARGGGPPDLGRLLGEAATGDAASSGATTGDTSSSGAAAPTSKSAEDLCAPFIDKLLACAVEQAVEPLDQGASDAAARAFLDGCRHLLELPEASLTSAFTSCAEAPCEAYGECVAGALADAGDDP